MVEVKGKVEADLVAVGWEMEVGGLVVVVLVMGEGEWVVEVKVEAGLVAVGWVKEVGDSEVVVLVEVE